MSRVSRPTKRSNYITLRGDTFAQSKASEAKAFKMIVAGEEMAGKTQLLHLLMGGNFDEDYHRSIATHFEFLETTTGRSAQEVKDEDDTVTVQANEYPGREDTHPKGAKFAKGVHMLCLVVDLTNEASLPYAKQILDKFADASE